MVENKIVQRIVVTKMRILRCMSGITRKDIIKEMKM